MLFKGNMYIYVYTCRHKNKLLLKSLKINHSRNDTMG